MKRIIYILMPAIILLLASCHSSKKTTEKGIDKVTSPTTVITSDLRNNTQTNFTAKVKVAITQNGNTMSTNGHLRMRKGEVIQITLSDPVFGITEVGRMELSPENILIIDRINRRYVECKYDEFDAFKGKNIDFTNIQDFFWDKAQNSNEVSYSIPSKSEIKLDLKLSDKGNQSNWEAHTKVSSKYVKTDANKLFSSLVGE